MSISPGKQFVLIESQSSDIIEILNCIRKQITGIGEEETTKEKKGEKQKHILQWVMRMETFETSFP